MDWVLWVLLGGPDFVMALGWTVIALIILAISSIVRKVKP